MYVPENLNKKKLKKQNHELLMGPFAYLCFICQLFNSWLQDTDFANSFADFVKPFCKFPEGWDGMVKVGECSETGESAKIAFPFFHKWKCPTAR